MKYQLKKCYWLLVACLFASYGAVANSIAVVQVNVNGKPVQSLSFNERPRLDSLVINSLKFSKQSMINVDWGASGFFDLSKPFVSKDKVISDLEFSAVNSSDKEHKAVLALVAKLKEMNFAKREFIDLDPDFIRLSEKGNPKIDGKWLLSVKHTPQKVLVVGAVNHNKNVEWQSRTDALSYIHQANLLNTNTSSVIVIQPDGVIQKHQVAYWNSDFQEVAPGAIIYVPFVSADSALDKAVIELLKNRI
ncbi:capsule biosynthesis GfcC family protein [Parashewanella tropica]|uniref:capsule biosynthesis GfcC family protein n=1 Tax=Parashewanella tropica TaxID=2547970 RepID=UPI00105979AF|nr:capsule biosynthesis GfcC family protein [Parashewanella tropica]